MVVLTLSRYTDKSDIFSFGVILGILLSSRDVMEQSSSDGEGEETGEAAVDRSISFREEGVGEDEMALALRIAGVCVSDLAEDRPSSDELLLMLTQLHCF